MVAPVGLYATDGSINISIVDGNSITDRFANDGSLNVVDSSGVSGRTGENHPCGALWVTLDNIGPNSFYASNGSVNVTTTPYNGKGAWRVTVVSGSFAGGGGGTDSIWGLGGLYGTWS